MSKTLNKLLTVGCSFSALYYHSDPCESYTLRLAKAFDSKLINLNSPGAGPSTVFRLLHNYLLNPIYGVPDFVFIQVPFPTRQEYWADADENSLSQTFNLLKDKLIWVSKDMNKNKYQGIRDAKHQENKAFAPEHIYRELLEFAGEFHTGGHTGNWDELNERLIAVTSTVDTKDSLDADHWFVSTNTLSPQLEKSHDMYFIERSQRIVYLHTYVRLIEQLLESKSIKYCYVETGHQTKIADSTCFIDELLQATPDGPGHTEEIKQAYNYAKTLCSKEHFIPYACINQGSSTYMNDNYECYHPGSKSHEAFTKLIIPEIEKRL